MGASDPYALIIEIRAEDTGAWKMTVNGKLEYIARESEHMTRAEIERELPSAAEAAIADWTRRLRAIEGEDVDG